MESSGLEELAGAGVLRRRSGRLSDAAAAVGLAGRAKGVSSLCSARSSSEDALRNHGLATSHHAVPLRKGGVRFTLHTHPQATPGSASRVHPFLSVHNTPAAVDRRTCAQEIFFFFLRTVFNLFWSGGWVHKDASKLDIGGFGLVSSSVDRGKDPASNAKAGF